MGESIRVQAAAVLFVNRRGELLIRLRDNDPLISFPDQWDLIGGKLEPGESVQEALRREALEELGETVGDCAFLGSFDGAEAVIHVFVGILEKRSEDLTLTEGQRIEFFSPEAASRLPLVPWVVDMLAAYRASAGR